MPQTAKKSTQLGYQTTEILKLFPLQGEWTEAEYFSLPDTSHLVELSEGRLIIPDMPGDDHQKVAINLSTILHTYVREHKLGEVRFSPLPVRIWKDKIREPNVVFMSSSHSRRIRKKFWGVPDLLMEIISKSNEWVDRVVKFAEYAQAGIPEYWIIDPNKKTIEVFYLEQGHYILLEKCGIVDTAHSRILGGFEIGVDAVM